jgi:hypothetical protein
MESKKCVGISEKVGVNLKTLAGMTTRKIHLEKRRKLYVMCATKFSKQRTG